LARNTDPGTPRRGPAAQPLPPWRHRSPGRRRA